MQGNAKGFIKLLKYLPYSKNIVDDLTQLGKFTQEFAPKVINKDSEGIDDIYINIIKTIALSELSREEKAENIKLVDTLFYWNSKRQRALREEIYIHLINRIES